MIRLAATAIFGVLYVVARTRSVEPIQSPELPQFEVQPGWLKVPSKWRLGNTSAVSVDGQGHVWILHRPRTLPDDLRSLAAPPVLEFDNAGNFIQGWGGAPSSGQPTYEWPQNEHGLHVDHRRFVWIVGNAIPEDGQIGKGGGAGLQKFAFKGFSPRR